MSEYGAVIAHGIEAAALSAAGVQIDVYLPYGSDLLVAGATAADALTPGGPTGSTSMRRLLAGTAVRARHALREPVASWHRLRQGPVSRHFRGAITTARHLVVDHHNPQFDRLLDALPIEGHVHRSAWPFLYPATYRPSPSGPVQWDVHWRREIDRIRSGTDVILLYHGRHEWRTYVDDYTFKNTHHLIRGFADFIGRHPELSAKLATVAYGSDVDASRDLIGRLGLESSVAWFPKMYRKDLMYLVGTADLCAGEFGMSYLTFGTIIEAMSLGKPVIHHRDDSLYPESSLYPVVNAREPGEISAALSQFVNERADWQARGPELARWVDHHVIEGPLDLISACIGASERRSRD